MQIRFSGSYRVPKDTIALRIGNSRWSGRGFDSRQRARPDCSIARLFPNGTIAGVMNSGAASISELVGNVRRAAADEWPWRHRNADVELWIHRPGLSERHETYAGHRDRDHNAPERSKPG
jgi:hypothetical protein